MALNHARLRIHFSVRRPLITAACWATVLSGCAETPVEQPLVGYQLRTTEIWNGGDLVLTSPSIPQIHETIRVVVNGDTFPSVYRRGDSIVFRADVPASGTYRISVVPVLLPAQDSPDEVTIRGMAACYPGPEMSGYPLPWPERDRLSTFVADGAESAIIVDAATGESRPAVPPAAHDPGLGMGPGWTTEPLSVALSGSIVNGVASTCVWRLEPSPEPIDCRGGFSHYTLAQLGPGKWVFADHHWTDLFWGDTLRFWSRFEGPDGLVLSPRRDYVIVSGLSDEGQLLISAADDEPIVRIPLLRDSGAPAAFTPDGDTVFMIGRAHIGDTVRTLVEFEVTRPTTQIASTVLAEDWYSDIAVDPAAPFLYVLHAGTAAVTVLDRRTLEAVGTLRPATGGCPLSIQFSRLRLARNSAALYAIGASSYRYPATSSWIVRYDLMTPMEE
jgi:hypothetical protein